MKDCVSLTASVSFASFTAPSSSILISKVSYRSCCVNSPSNSKMVVRTSRTMVENFSQQELSFKEFTMAVVGLSSKFSFKESAL